jgi:hypothetical protein
VALEHPIANDFDEQLDEVLDHARNRRRDEAIKALSRLVPEYKPKHLRDRDSLIG